MIPLPVSKLLILARIYTTDLNGGRAKAEAARKLVEACRVLRDRHGINLTLRFVVMSGTDYVECDVGDIKTHLLTLYGTESFVDVDTTEKDQSCGCINDAGQKALDQGYTHMLLISPSAASYLSPENYLAMEVQCNGGAKAVGLSLEEVPGEVMDNSFAIWHLQSLADVGWFDSRSSTPRKGERRTMVEIEGGEQVPLAGVEEVIPLIRMIKQSGGEPCFAFINPVTGGKRMLETIGDRAERDRRKYLSKALRRQGMAALEGVDIAFLETGRVA